MQALRTPGGRDHALIRAGLAADFAQGCRAGIAVHQLADAQQNVGCLGLQHVMQVKLHGEQLGGDDIGRRCRRIGPQGRVMQQEIDRIEPKAVHPAV
jgi:hypothetical protein